MSSLEMFGLLDLAQRRQKGLVASGERQSPFPGSVRSASRLLTDLGQRSLLLFALLLLWEAAPRFELIDPVFLPPFSEVIAAGWQLALNRRALRRRLREPAARIERISDFLGLDRAAWSGRRLVCPPW
ncbi:hypothetical protein ACVWW4_000331 [Bradyrhizobium sp. LB7.1]